MKNIYEQISIKQFKIDRIIPLEKFRRFLIYACYYNEINKRYFNHLLNYLKLML
jgi:hypothetical protein